MTTAEPPQPLIELRLPPEVKAAVNEAYVPGNQAIAVAFTDDEGRPNMSFRGSVVALSDTALAFWARHADGATMHAAERGAEMVLLHRMPGEVNGPSQAVITFRGRGRLAQDEAERRAIYDTMVQRERDGDKDYTGVGIVVDLDTVSGYVPGIRMRMTR